jgi:hypothetical protein
MQRLRSSLQMGEQWLKISPGGAMLTEDKGVEPIVPMGLLATKVTARCVGERGSWRKRRSVAGN